MIGLRPLTLVLMGWLLATASLHTRADELTDLTQLFRNGSQAEALAKLDTLVSEQPGRADLRFLKGVLQTEAKRPDDALLTFQLLTEEFPEIPEPYNNLAALHAARGDFEKARIALEGALRANPSFAAAHQNLGDVYTQLARESYQRALKLEPGNSTIPARLSMLRGLTDPSPRKPNP